MYRTGTEIYEELERTGRLEGHSGKEVWIHPDSENYVIGDGIPAAEELRRAVLSWLNTPSQIDVAETFYSRRIGGLDEI